MKTRPAQRQMLDAGFRCELCHRRMRDPTTLHHLIPRACHRNQWFQRRFSREQMLKTVPLCRDCHSAVHRLIPKEKELGRFYHTIELLLAHTEVKKFVDWVRRQK